MKGTRTDGVSPGAGAAWGALTGLIAQKLGLTALLPFGGLEPAVLTAGAVTGMVLWRRFSWLVAGALVVTGAAWLAIQWTPVAVPLARSLIDRDSLARADAVFVLNHDVQPDGSLTGVALARLLHGVGLVMDGWAPRLAVSNEPPGDDPPFSGAAAALLDRLRLDVEIVDVTGADDTYGEAVRVGEVARERGWVRLIVVTSPLHSRRACGAVRHQGISVICSPATEPQFDVENLVKPGDRLQAFRQFLTECLSLAFYRWRGWIGRGAGALP